MKQTLNDIMEFDHVVIVHEDGTVADAPRGIYAPNLLDGELDSADWTMLNGYSGQDRYSGPVMHSSEFIGGLMERDIRETPGVYVAIVAYYSPDALADDDAEYITDGWAVARLDDAVPTAWTPTPGGRYPFEYDHDDACANCGRTLAPGEVANCGVCRGERLPR